VSVGWLPLAEGQCVNTSAVHRNSKSEVSRICAGLDEQVVAYDSRPLDHYGFPYLILVAI